MRNKVVKKLLMIAMAVTMIYGLCKRKPTGGGDNDTGSRRNGNRINRRYGEERGYRKGHRGRG